MITIPPLLLDQVKQGNVLLFVGERILRDPQNRIIRDELTSRLMRQCEDDDVEYAFPEAAQVYQDEHGREALVDFVRQELETMGGDEPQPIHHRIVELCSRINGLHDHGTALVTTCVDRRLEQAFRQGELPHEVMIQHIKRSHIHDGTPPFQPYPSPGLEPDLYRRLQSTLLTCGPFESDASLQAVFVNARINPWCNGIPRASTPERRVQAIIAYLHDQYNVDGENALGLFLRVLNEQMDPALACYRDLAQLARELESARQTVCPPKIGNTPDKSASDCKITLHKLCGSIENETSLVLTEDDYTNLRYAPYLSEQLQGELADKTILLMGYDMADKNFQALYQSVEKNIEAALKPAYAFNRLPSSKTARWCERRKITVIEADTSALLETLVQHLSPKFEESVGEVVDLSLPPEPLPEHPYKFLDYYESSDAAIFFGRQREIKDLAALIHARRLVLLYGASGAGKTSLLLAGVAPFLEKSASPYHMLYVRVWDDPALGIRHAVQRQLPPESPAWALPETTSLVDFLYTATHFLKDRLVIVLDQFEEFFIRLGPESRALFIAELGALHDAWDVPVRIVLSLREDWLASMAEIKQRIPNIYHNEMRLLPLNRQQAREAIVQPVQRLGYTYEPELVEHILDDLADVDGIIIPPQLQLVCTALFERVTNATRTDFKLSDYTALGGIQKILGSYLEKALAEFPKFKRVLARELLKELVTAEQTKKVETVGNLCRALDVEQSVLDAVLADLEQARLLRRVKQDIGDERAYELAHDYLAREIAQGIDEEETEAKKARELLQRELISWRSIGKLMDLDALTFIHKQREHLRRLEADEIKLLLCSALHAGYEAPYWFQYAQMHASEVVEAVLADDRGGELIVDFLIDTLDTAHTDACVWIVHTILKQKTRDIASALRDILIEHEFKPHISARRDPVAGELDAGTIVCVADQDQQPSWLGRMVERIAARKDNMATQVLKDLSVADTDDHIHSLAAMALCQLSNPSEPEPGEWRPLAVEIEAFFAQFQRTGEHND